MPKLCQCVEKAAHPGSSLRNPIQLRCSNCMFPLLHTPKFMKWDPLNQPYNFHEDGFNAFVKKSREWLPFNRVVREHTKMKGQIMKL